MLRVTCYALRVARLDILTFRRGTRNMSFYSYLTNND